MTSTKYHTIENGFKIVKYLKKYEAGNKNSQ